MKTTHNKGTKRVRRHTRIRSKVKGTADCPRLSVFKSNKFIYVQLIDDVAGKTLASASTKAAAGKTVGEKAKVVGKEIAKIGQEKKITKVVFDRGGYNYAGNVAALAAAAREGGLKF
jgi:large subunit ribosomal protein L18